MKKQYIAPAINIYEIDATEVICTSYGVATVSICGESVSQETFRSQFITTQDDEIVASSNAYRSNLW